MSRAPDLARRRGFIAATALAASLLARIHQVNARANYSRSAETTRLPVRAELEGNDLRQSDKQAHRDQREPVMVFFTDRPERIASNMKDRGAHRFGARARTASSPTPPNADVSLLERKTLKQIVVELQDLVLTGDDLATVKVQQVEMPGKAADVSVFIDIIGRPTTPLSFAGVAGHIGTADT